MKEEGGEWQEPIQQGNIKRKHDMTADNANKEK